MNDLPCIPSSLVNDLELQGAPIRALGKDQGGEVFLAEYPDGRAICLKRNIDPNAIPLIARAMEVRAQSSIPSEDLLKFVTKDAPELGGWFATSFIPGVPLPGLIDPPLESIFVLARDMFERVLQVQADGIIHGNFKPANVVRRPTSGVGLIDIDTLDYLGSHERPPLGNSWCMPPERYSQRTQIGSEVYSVGMVTAMLFGRRFMEALYPKLAGAENIRELKQSIISDKLNGVFLDANVQKRVEGMCEGFSDQNVKTFRIATRLVLACAQKDPESRPQSIEEFEELLKST